MLRKNIETYLKKWVAKGYENGIPDEVPPELAKLNLAPSYKALALCILNNDHHLSKLGGTRPKSKWYSALKKQELADRKEGREFTPLRARDDDEFI